MSKKILLIGDPIIDEFTYSTKLGISAETPTVVGKYDRVVRQCGGALNVLKNLLHLGANVTYVSVAPVNEIINLVRNELKISELWRQLTVVDIDIYPLVEKRRYYVDGYKMLQIDKLSATVNPIARDRVAAHMTRLIGDHDLTIVSDYRHGLFDETLAKHIVAEGNRFDREVLVDTQVSQSDSNHWCYTGCAMMFMNKHELSASGFTDNPIRAGLEYDCDILLKLGANGSQLWDSGRNVSWSFKGTDVHVVDTTGAGDAYLAAYAVSGDHDRANYWAGLSVTQKGTTLPSKEMWDDKIASS